jgi:epoxyqueuosine reductase
MATISKESQCSDSTAGIAETVRNKALSLGFCACGFAKADRVDSDAIDFYDKWIADGCCDTMDYCAHYSELRNDPRQLFPGALTVVSVAMNYFPAQFQPADAPQFAFYAYGRDYHDVVRERLRQLAAYIMQISAGAQSRVCVDTAPVRERYWAQHAGIGFIGKNGLLIVPDVGSYVFLGELITTVFIPADTPCMASCAGCGACLSTCPGHALGNGGSVDARRCLSCLTIEHRGDLPDWLHGSIGNHVYGCDECQICCPHNAQVQPTEIKDFAPSSQFLSLTGDSIAAMTDADFRSVFRHSAVRRAKLSGLQRNLSVITNKK